MAAVRPEQPVPTMMTFSISDGIELVVWMRFDAELKQTGYSLKSTAFEPAQLKDVLSSFVRRPTG